MKALFRKILYQLLTAIFGRDKLIFLLSDDTERTLLGFKTSGYLHDIGWTNTISNQDIIDVNGAPLPWVTYPFIAFIEKRLRSDFELFEYGSGNSTLYYSKKVAFVTSVENDREWFDKISKAMPENVKLNFMPLERGGDYCQFAQSTNKTYNIIIVDGRDRVNCCKQSIAALKPDGILVLDDSERAEYAEAVDFLTGNGFKRLDFLGLAPTVTYLKCTTIFYHENNCLAI